MGEILLFFKNSKLFADVDVVLLVSNSSLWGDHSIKLRIYQWLYFMIKVTYHEIYILDTMHMSVLLIVKHAVQQGSPIPLLSAPT